MMLATPETPTRQRKRQRSESPLAMEILSPDPTWTWTLQQALASRRQKFELWSPSQEPLRPPEVSSLRLQPQSAPSLRTSFRLPACVQGGIYSPDVIGHVMSFLGPPPAERSGASTRPAQDWSHVARLRATSQLWDTALGHYLELRVVPLQTEVDPRGATCWRPSCPAVLFQVLLHVGNGITERFHQDWLQELRVDFDIGADRVSAIGVLTTANVNQGLKSLTLQCASGADEMQYLEQLSRFASLKKIQLQRSARMRTRPCKLGAVPAALQLAECEDDFVPKLEALALNDCRGVEARLAIALAPGSAPSALSASISGLRSLSIYDPLPKFRNNAALEPLLGRLSGLREIHLFHLDLAALPEAVFQLTGLEHLDCSYNSLRDLPDRIACLQQLQRLVATSNQIESLPDAIGDLPNLRELHLGGNRLERLPDAACDLPRLEVLELFDNRLQSLPATLGNLVTLKRLNVRGNHLQQLPDSVGQLSLLDEMRLDNNNLWALPEGLGGLQSLEILSVRSCKIARLPDTLTNLTNLHTLLLSRNHLSTLPTYFGNLSRLRRLEADHNRLKALPESVSGLRSLVHLLLGHNDIESLPTSLGDIPLLETLSIPHNPIQCTAAVLARLQRVKRVELPEPTVTTFFPRPERDPSRAKQIWGPYPDTVRTSH